MPASFPRRSSNQPQRPEMFEAWVPRFPKANGALAAATEELVKGYREFYNTHLRSMTDESITPGARHVKSAKTARAKLLPLIEGVDAASDRAAAIASELSAQLSNVFNPPDKKYETVSRHREIRDYFKTLPTGEKLKALEAARKAGDDDTLIALASYQPFLSGLPPQMHQMARDHLIETHAPAEAETLKTLGEQRQMAHQLRETMLQTVADMVDFQKADEIIAAASNDLA